MPVLDLSFEWPVDGLGYSISKPSKGEWPVGDTGFKIGGQKSKPPKGRKARIITGEPSGPHIVRKGGQLRITRPLESYSTLFMEFALLDGTDESCLCFASK